MRGPKRMRGPWLASQHRSRAPLAESRADAEWEVPARPGNSSSSAAARHLQGSHRLEHKAGAASWAAGHWRQAAGCVAVHAGPTLPMMSRPKREKKFSISTGSPVCEADAAGQAGARSGAGSCPFYSSCLLYTGSPIHMRARQVTVVVTGGAAAGKLGPMHWQFSALHRLCRWQAASHSDSAPAPPCPAAPRRAARSRQTCRAWRPGTSCAGQAGSPCGAETKCPGGQAAIMHSRLSGTARAPQQSRCPAQKPPTRRHLAPRPLVSRDDAPAPSQQLTARSRPNQGTVDTASPAAHAPHLAVSGDQALAHHKVQDLAQQALGVVVGVVEQDLRAARGGGARAWVASGPQVPCWVASRRVVLCWSVGHSASAWQAHGVGSWVWQPTASRRHRWDHHAAALTCFAISGSDTMTNCLGPKASLKILP